MRKLLIAAVMAACVIIPASANASAGGAQRAVKREISFDYGKSASVECHSVGRSRYSCWIGVYAWNGSYNELIQGAARVSQRGSRYSVDYRIHW